MSEAGDSRSIPDALTIDRRQFLRMAAGGALAATGLYGCGGGGGNGGDGGLMPFAQRQAVFDAIKDKISTMTAPGADSRRQELLDMLQTRPELSAAGASFDGSLWGHFTDGAYLMIIANREIPTAADIPPMGTPINRAAPAEVPVRTQARLLSGVDATIPTVISQLQGILASRGYQIASNAGTGTIYDLRRVTGDGVFYLGAHGGVMPDLSLRDMYGVTSATPVSLNVDPDLFDDIRKGRIIYAPITNLNFSRFPVQYYAVTAKWVEKYWFFGSQSLVYIDACASASAEASDFITECFKSNAGVYAGWTLPSEAGKMNRAALFTIDRMTGANAFEIESPEQRPFDYVSIKRDLDRLGWDRTAYGRRVSEFVFKKGTLGESGVLNPTIKFMDMNELEDTLILTGKFGTRPQGPLARVTVGGYPQTIKSWAKEKIEVTIPVSGNGSIGEVIVYCGNRKSNSRWLSEWKPKLTIRQQGDGRLKWEGPLNLRFRADAASYREEAGDRPRYRDSIPFRATRDITGRWDASGRYDYPNQPGAWQDWKEFADLVNSEFNTTAENTIVCYGVIQPNQGKIRLALTAESNEGMRVVTSWGDDNVLVGTTGLLDGPFSSVDNTPCLVLDLNGYFGIAANSRIERPAGYALTTSWLEANPNPPINDSAARSIGVSRAKATKSP